MRAEDLDNICLPINRTVAQVGRIQGRFLVVVIWLIRVKVIERFRRRIRRNGLREKSVDPVLVFLK